MKLKIPGKAVRDSDCNKNAFSGIFNSTVGILHQDSLSKLIETEINPHVAQWEEQKQFPVHEVMKKFGQGGFLGASFPVEDGGMGLDYSYTVAIAETMGEITCGAIPMAVGVQMDMATPGTSSEPEGCHYGVMQIRLSEFG